jgi:hypothetical protein
MRAVQVLGLLLAVSVAVNLGLAAGITARHAGASFPQAALTAAGATGTAMGLFFTALSAYR